jgi:hypothetical protein
MITKSSPPSTACSSTGTVVIPICTLPDRMAGGILVTTGRRVSVASMLCFSKKPLSLAT